MESIKIEIRDLVDIDSIAEEYNISKKELISFHNRNCALHELLPESLPKYISSIYIPVEKYTQWKEKQLPASRIDRPGISEKLTYGVLINQKSSELQISYLIDIHRFAEHKASVYRQKLEVNNHDVEFMVEKLMETAGEALYPIHLSLDRKGKPDAIENGEDIQARWKETFRPKIKQYYEGEVTDGLISQIDHFYDTIKNGLGSLQRNIFYPVFFLPVYDSYPDHEKKERLDFYFPSFGETVSYDAVFSLQKTFTEKGRMLVRIKGEQYYEEISLDEDKGKIDLVYQLDKETRNIFSVTGSLSTFYDNQEVKIDIEIYRQEAYI
ncbi:MAG: hypothetical protein LBE92_13085 [Chryseobacterium sp.]|uniref:hypothetical protein n=1 Tax=Chryseobacterium sp. TaxID=1871047 RepID=UPI002834482A|nr:hypothetical protein [Chryseobacterium sp.]MDR2237049.1 hypothetical protein [Chryseobacterium sp.]